MRITLIISVFIILSIQKVCYGQKFADKQFYLVDSLDLQNVSNRDKQRLDSILTLFHKTKSDTLRVYLLNVFIEDCWDDNLWPKYNQWNYNFINQKLKQKLNSKESRFFKINSAGALNNMGYYYDKLGNISLGLEYYQKSLKIVEPLGDQLSIARLLNNIGLIHRKQNNLNIAIEYYQRCLVILYKLSDSSAVATVSSNLASIYYENKDFEMALQTFQNALRIYQNIQMQSGVAMASSSIGNIIVEQGDTAKALEYYNKAKDIWEKMNYNEGLAHAYLQIAKIEYLRKNYKGNNGALGLAQKSLKLSQEVGYPETIKDASDLLFQIYKSMNEPAKALEMYTLFIQMRDSINNIETQKAAIEQKTKYEYENKKALDDKENEKRIALEKEKQQRQYLILIYTVVAASVVFILLLIIYRRLQITKKQKLIIEEQKELLAETNEELNQTNEELATQRDEIERQKLIVEEQRDDIVASIEYAKRIQTAILPPFSVLNQYLPNNFVLYQPKDVVAGDFYWLETKGDDIFIAAADCTGHGVPGAMVSVVCHGALNRCVREYNLTTPSEILDKTRELVLETFQKSEEQVKDGMDISLLKLNFKTQKAEWAGANNPLYLLRHSKGSTTEESLIEITKPDKQPIGFVAEPKPFTNHILSLNNINQIYLFTDGYADQFGGDKGKKMGYNTFREKLLEISNRDMCTQKEILNTYFSKWKGKDEQIDDVCIVGIRI